MRRSCVIVDDFLPEPEAFRAVALGQEFGPVEYEGHAYAGIATGFPIFDLPGMKSRFESAAGFPVDLQMEFWRVGTSGENVTSWIHADTICADHAALIYLSEPEPESGTAFWKHLDLGWHGLPDGGIDEATADRLVADSHDAEAWERTDLIHGRFNRLAVYPTARFHSRYPRDARGDSPETGRLIWVGFFNEARA